MILSDSSADKRTIKFFAMLEQRLKTLYNNKYDYSDTIYRTKRLNFSYKCPVHGEVTQNAGEHIRGHGCKACAILENSQILSSKSKDIFLDSCIKTHGDTYDYSKVEYKRSNIKILIVCKIHGDFLQNPIKHKNGSGCPKCALVARSKTKNQFLEIIKNKFINKNYIYINLPEIVKEEDKIVFICPFHGKQVQSLRGHLRGTGCVECNKKELRWSRSSFENQKTTLYYVKINNLYKIGLTKRNVFKRFETETQIRRNVEIISIWEFKNGGIAFDLEIECLRATKQYAIKTELLQKGGNSEIRKQDVLHIIKPIIENIFQ